MDAAPSILLATWQAVVDREDGVLPDGDIVGVDREIWDRVLEAIEGRGWVILHDEEDEMLVAKVRPADGVLIIVRRYDWDTFDFDFDLRELQTQVALDALCDFVRTVGQASQSDVTLFAEGAQRSPDLRYAVYRSREDDFELC